MNPFNEGGINIFPPGIKSLQNGNFSYASVLQSLSCLSILKDIINNQNIIA